MSLFSDKLNSNYVPNEEEVATIKQLLVEPDKKLHDITGEIEDIKAQLEKLFQEKEEINEQLKAHKALLSPARRLPPDVIQRIFHYCLPSDRNPVLSTREAPLLLGRICSQWRDIALATPKLWAAIHIAIPADPPMPMPPMGVTPPPVAPQTDHTTRIQAIATWLSRSDPFPLSISIYNSRFDNVAGNSVQQYLDVVLNFMSRWKHIHMSVPHQVWNNFLPRVRANDVPILEKIYFDSAMGYHGVPGSPGTGSRRESGILRAPNLRSVSLIQFETHVLHLPLRWNRLTELNLSGSIPTWQPIEGPSITESLAILTLCPNLEYFSVQLSLAGFTPLENGDDGLPNVTMNKLLGLAVTETNNVDSAPLFRHLTAPAVRHLKFRRTSPNSYITPPDLGHAPALRVIHIPLAMFIRRASGPIEEFELDALYMSEVDVMKCLSLMPGLKKLSLWSYGSSGAPASPYATPTLPAWENALFTLDDRHMKRFVPGLSSSTDAETSRGAFSTNRPAGSWGTQWTPPSRLSSPSSPRSPRSRRSSPSPHRSPRSPRSPSPSPPSPSSPSIPTAQADEPSSQQALPDVIPTLNENQDVASGSNLLTPDDPAQGDENSGSDVAINNDATDNTSSPRAPSDVSTYFTVPLPPLSNSLSKDKGKSRATGTETEPDSEYVRVDTSDILCPLLESFQCSGAVFSDETMLAFLRTRSSLASKPTSSAPLPEPSSSKAKLEPSLDPYQEPAHLRRCRISFSIGREENDEIKEKLEEIRKETAMSLDVHYPPLPISSYYRRYSPYDGLPSVPVLGAAPGVNANGNVHTVSTTGGLGSGEPVFLYSAAFH